MAGQWSRFLTGAALTLCVSGHALAQDGKITVFAAASLTNAMQDIAQAYKKERHVEVVSSFASSSTLARQIEAGAPADLFISAVMSLAIDSILSSDGHLSNKALILWLINALETTDNVVTADVIRKTLEIVVGYTMDDI